jgi:tetratricopeptide (TPR) repeat protein
MSEAMAEADVARLEGLVGSDPGAPAFPALAEALRRAGRAKDAEQVARAGLARRPEAAAGRVALGLALLDLGRGDEARRELERAIEGAPGHPLAAPRLAKVAPEPGWQAPPPVPAEPALAEAIDEGEIDDAFELARPEADEPLSPDEAVASALHDAELEGPEELDDEAELDEGELPIASRTVADLLERQGHVDDARAMRASLDAGRHADRERVLATLERWLDNLRRRRT